MCALNVGSALVAALANIRSLKGKLFLSGATLQALRGASTVLAQDHSQPTCVYVPFFAVRCVGMLSSIHLVLLHERVNKPLTKAPQWSEIPFDAGGRSILSTRDRNS